MSLDTFNIISGIITIIAFGFAIFQHIRYSKKEDNERIRREILKSLMDTLSKSAVSSLHNVDMLISKSKAMKIKTHEIGELQGIARSIRSELLIFSDLLSVEKTKLRNWRYGKLIESNDAPKSKTNEK